MYVYVYMYVYEHTRIRKGESLMDEQKYNSVWNYVSAHAADHRGLAHRDRHTRLISAVIDAEYLAKGERAPDAEEMRELSACVENAMKHAEYAKKREKAVAG